MNEERSRGAQVFGVEGVVIFRLQPHPQSLLRVGVIVVVDIYHAPLAEICWFVIVICDGGLLSLYS